MMNTLALATLKYLYHAWIRPMPSPKGNVCASDGFAQNSMDGHSNEWRGLIGLRRRIVSEERLAELSVICDAISSIGHVLDAWCSIVDAPTSDLQSYFEHMRHRDTVAQTVLWDILRILLDDGIHWSKQSKFSAFSLRLEQINFICLIDGISKREMTQFASL